MPRFRGFVFTSLLVVLAFPCHGGKKRDWQAGKVMDADAYEYQSQTGSVTRGTVSDSGTVNLRTRSSTDTVKQSRFVIIGSTYSYTVEQITSNVAPAGGLLTQAIAASRHRKACHLIIGSDVQFAEDRTALHVLDADHRECKLEILRQERITPQAK